MSLPQVDRGDTVPSHVQVGQRSSSGPSDSSNVEALQALLASLRMENFRFVGDSSGTSGPYLLEPNDAALLVATRNSATLNAVLEAGVSFQTPQIERLERWGLLRQEGMEFRSLIPILLEEEAAQLRAALDDSLTDVEAAVHPAFENLRAELSATGGADAFPAVATWVVQELSWRYLVEGSLDLRSRVRTQRQQHPERGWWGLLWYVDNPAAAVNRVVSYYSDGSTLQVCWPLGREPFVDATAALHVPSITFLNLLDVEGRRVDGVDRVRALEPLGIFDRQGRLLIPVLRWNERQVEGPAAAAGAAARAVAGAMANDPVRSRLRRLVGTDDDALITTIAYAELAPRLLRALGDRGLPTMVAGHGNGDASSGGAADAIQDGVQASANARPFAVAVWQGLLPRDPILSFPW